MRSLRFAVFGAALIVGLVSSSVSAKPLSEAEVPAPLKGWIPWVMHDVAKNDCPFIYSAQDQHVCMWPTSLSLKFTANSGSFDYAFTIYDTPDGNPQRVTLPGQTDAWPQSVTVNGEAKPVLLYNGVPTLLLGKGEFAIHGEIAWDKMPVSFTLPPQVGIVNLSVNGAAVNVPEIENGQLLVQRTAQPEAATAESRLDTKVFRKITDSIPQIVETRVQLNVSGKQREENIGNVLLPGSVPIDINSDLPARLDGDGKLRVQLRAGTYNVIIASRLSSATNHLALPAQNGQLPAEEIWSFETQNNLRLVQLTGAQAIDPTQTELPAEWHSLPAYYLKKGDVIDIQEIKRGAAEASPDQLNLQRKLWLDYSGAGYTIQDMINGQIRSSSRLEVQDGVNLGSATINGQDQYITTIKQDGQVSNPGVEVREGQFSMVSNSRFDRRADIGVTGWKSNFDSVNATLFLPPGWSLLAYSGVDSASQSWIDSWTLVDIFLVMIAAVAAYRFWGLRLGLIAGLGLVLIHPELKSFTSFLLTAILCLAIERALKGGKLKGFIGMLAKLVILLMVVSALPFMLTHLREAMYPQLADGSHGWNMPGGFGINNRLARMDAAPEMAAGQPEDMAPPPPPAVQAMPASPEAMEYEEKNNGIASTMKSKDGVLPRMRSKGEYMAKKSLSAASEAIQQQYQSYAPDTKVQTGYGNRNISEYGITLHWNGSVDPMVKMHLWLISGKMNLLLALTRVCLIALMIAALIGGILPRLREKMRFIFPLVALMVIFSAMPHSSAWAQDAGVPAAAAAQAASVFPPQPLLDELKRRLSENISKPKDCLPECASLARTRIKIAGNQLELELEIHADDDVAVPLPGSTANWRPAGVWVNGEAAPALTVDGNGYVVARLGKGVSHVRMAGMIPANRDSLGISFPMVSRYSSSEAAGWAVLGIRDNGVTESSVQLNRTERSAAVKSDEANFEKTALPPFYQVERTLSLGNRWEVTTVVRKLTPADSPSAIEVPLLAGESVTSSDTQVKNGKAYASFDPGESEAVFSSVLPQSDTMTLTAPTGLPWVEVWKLNASNLWHVKADGIPRIYEANTATPDTANIMPPGASGYSLWMPWPGEKLTLTIERPAGVEGATRTIDSTNLTVTPSDRSTDAMLNIVIRSSLGGQHDITLPEGAVLTNVARQDRTLPSQMKGNVLTLPLTPGSNSFSINWKEQATLDSGYRPSSVGIGADRSVNAVVNISVPPNRWILFTAGPLMGPAVLFWSWVPVILILSFGLGKIEASPLRMKHWFIMLLGLSFSSSTGIIMIIAWVLAFSWRGNSEHEELKNFRFNIVQLALVILTLTVMPILLECIHDGLLGYPEMNIRGNNSYGYDLHWYQDITGDTLPQPLIISLPLWFYRALMLLWALWLAFSMVKWLRWSWESFTRGGYWRKVWGNKKPKEATAESEAK